MTPIEKYNNEIMNGFQQAKGKGYCFCINPITPYKLVALTAINVCNKDKERTCFIVTPYYDVSNKIKFEIEKAAPNNDFKINFTGKQYINPKFNYNYDCIITIGINGDEKDDVEKLRKLNSCSKFTLFVFTESSLSAEINEFLVRHSSFIKTSVTPNEARVAYLNCPVEEWRYGVPFSEIEQEEYDKATKYINDCITIFGGLSNIEKCARGDNLLNISASEFRYNFANENGWNEHLDMKSDYDRSIDEIYNPNTLNERANTFYTIIRNRKDMAIKNDNKLQIIANIVAENSNKKICIVSKSGETALAIANYLNQEEYQKLGIRCGQYHDCIPDTYATDSDGNIMLRKSGKDKGNPIILKSQASSTQYERLFNMGLINVLSIKFATNTKLKIAFDLIIFADSLTANIGQFKSRFANSYCTTIPNQVYRIYTINSIEERDINKENIPNNVQIMTQMAENYIL